MVLERVEAIPSMRFEDKYFSRTNRYSLGIDTASGRPYLAIPVSNALVDYEEHYEVDDDKYRKLLADESLAIQFADACRRREHDDLLIQKPGSNRGTPG
ncbi:hypothetical protein M2280_006308 [Prescottella agglutinans]|uniref:Uncharacterized protein n=2 Tax=Prescottella agglutinans TaxID=1644129 RepID=A0ABT6MLW7_9NOCA|nr:hypothetical protein [Prescottella agglutinans]